MVTLYLNGYERHHRYVHVLVAEHFLEDRPSAAHEVNHVDHDKRHNGAANLEWLTHPQNIAAAHARGLYDRKLNDRQRAEIVADPRPQVVIASEYGVHQSYVSMLKSGARRAPRPNMLT